GRRTSTWRYVFRIVTADGVDGWSSVNFSYEPWHQERPSIEARIVTKDGEVHRLDPATLTETQVGEESERVFSDRRAVNGPLRAVAPGAVVEQVIVCRDTAPFFAAGDTVRIRFGGFGAPVVRTRLVIDAPASLPMHYAVEQLPGLEPARTESS